MARRGVVTPLGRREAAPAKARHTSERELTFMSQPLRLITCPTEAHRREQGSLWSLWSFNERHTAAHTFPRPVNRHVMMSTAAGAGPGSCATPPPNQCG
ncbi:hypothetical protein T484DRAFT_1669400 [Baffinella frigidus]|nr:hypothetical protein T484DRAFT_1669400 [Cryptophyta sp. CCMP2293]